MIFAPPPQPSHQILFNFKGWNTMKLLNILEKQKERETTDEGYPPL